MSFFLNPFSQDFIAAWLLSDRQFIPDFKCPRNAGRGDEIVVSYAGTGPFDLSGNDTDGNSKAVLTISFALNDAKNWADLPITITGDDQSAVSVTEVVSSLRDDSTFSNYFTANAVNGSIQIRQVKPATSMKFYIKKGRAETVLNFNKFIGVGELPTFFGKHTIDNRFTYADSQNQLILLDTSLNVDQAIIDNAIDAKENSLGFSHSTVLADWQLLKGKSGLFTFQKLTVDGSDRITQIIEYQAGSAAGDFARKINYTYSGSNKNPNSIVETPYTLAGGDLVTP